MAQRLSPSCLRLFPYRVHQLCAGRLSQRLREYRQNRSRATFNRRAALEPSRLLRMRGRLIRPCTASLGCRRITFRDDANLTARASRGRTVDRGGPRKGGAKPHHASEAWERATCESWSGGTRLCRSSSARQSRLGQAPPTSARCFVDSRRWTNCSLRFEISTLNCPGQWWTFWSRTKRPTLEM